MSVYSEESSVSDWQSSASGTNFSAADSAIAGDEHAAVRIKSNVYCVFYHVQRTKRPRLYLALRLLQFVQFFTFAFSSLIGAWSVVDDQFLSYIEVLRNFGLSLLHHYGILIMLESFALIYLLLMLLLGYSVQRSVKEGDDQKTRKSELLGLMLLVFSTVLYLPILSLCITILNCDTTTGNLRNFPDVPCWGTSNTVLSVFGIATGALAVGTGAFCSAFFYEWLPSEKNFITTVNGRYWMLQFSVNTILCVLAEFLRSFHLGTASVLAYGGALIVSNASLLYWAYFTLPFHHAGSNIIVCILNSVSLLAALVRTGSALSHQENIIGFVVFLVLSPIAGIVAWLVTKKRVALLYNVAINSTSDDKFTFKKDAEPEIASRFSYFSRDQVAVETSTLIYLQSLEQFPNSIGVRISHSVFLIPQPDELTSLSVAVTRTKKLWAAYPNHVYLLDYEYQIYCIDKTRRELVFVSDGGAEEVQTKLRHAMKFQEDCKKWIRAFWDQLNKEQDLSQLADVVAAIEKSETSAEAIYKKLLIRFSKNTRVLRAYAIFLEEVKNDLELSEVVFRAADELEEEKARKSKKKALRSKMKKLKKHSKKNSKKAKPPTPPHVNNFVDEEKGHHPLVSFSEEISEEEMKEMGPTPANDQVVDFHRTSSEEDLRTPEIGSPVVSDYQDEFEKPRKAPEIFSSFANQSKQKRIERLRQKKYRHNIENGRSAALKKLSYAIKITILVLVLDLTMVFISARIMSSIYADSVTYINKTGKLRDISQGVCQRARMAQLLYNQGNENYTSFLEQVNLKAELMDHTLHTSAAKRLNYGPIKHLWKGPQDKINFNPYMYAEYPDNRSTWFHTDQTRLWDLTDSFISNAMMFSTMEHERLVNASSDVTFRYLFDNVENVQGGAIKGTDLEAEKNQIWSDALQLFLIVLLVFSFCVLVLLATLLFAPALKKIKEERSGALKLFLAIPKSTISSIYDALCNTKSDDIADFEEEHHQERLAVENSTVEVTSAGIPIVKKLVIRYGGSLALAFAIIVIMFSISLAFIINYAPLGTVLSVAGARSYLGTEVSYLATELVMAEYITWPDGRDQIRKRIEEITDLLYRYELGLKFGDAELGLPGGMTYLDPRLDYLTNDKPCHLRDPNMQCIGLQQVIIELIRDAELLSDIPDEEITLDQEFLAEINSFMDPEGQLTVGFNDAVTYVGEYIASRIFVFNRIVGTIYGISFPLVILSYLLLRPLEKRIKEENARTLKMLLMIPIDVIDQVEEIKTYLESGHTESSQRKFNQLLENNLARSKKVIDGSTDAIVVANDKGIIEVFNPAAEKLFGYSAQEILNQNVSTLMPEETGRVHQAFIDQYLVTKKSRMIGKTTEQFGRRKDGSVLPISLTLSEASVGEKTIFSAFMRDITEQKEHEKELLKEKEYADQLLSSVLPKSIADQLKEEFRGKGNDRVLIAEAFKEVTVLFADIVGFTTMSGKIKPNELIILLNGLFSGWDELVEKWGMEKIKTIGDCYMVASGVPQRSVDHAKNAIEFAIEMLKYLEEFNKATNNKLQIRIGMNCGPVVAGVIGTKKMAFDLWGDAVNVASRMESTGVPCRIQVSQSTFELLKEEYIFEERGRLEVKGKGVMLTYLYKERKFERTSSGHKVRRNALSPYSAAPGTPLLQDKLPVRTFSQHFDGGQPTGNSLQPPTLVIKRSSTPPNAQTHRMDLIKLEDVHNGVSENSSDPISNSENDPQDTPSSKTESIPVPAHPEVANPESPNSKDTKKEPKDGSKTARSQKKEDSTKKMKRQQSHGHFRP